MQMWGRFLVAAALLLPGLTGATSASACSFDGSQIQIVDDSGTGASVPLSVDRIADPAYRTFVARVIEHLSARLGAAGLCPGDDGDADAVLVRFVRWPLVTSGDNPLPPLPTLDAGSGDGCRVVSPWAELAIDQQPVPRIRGLFVWNERQFLADQAALEDPRHAPDMRPAPLTQSSFERYADDYARSEILRPPASPAAANQGIEDRLPPDVLWLFRHSWQSTRGPFADAARGALRVAMNHAANTYTALVVALIDQCLASGKNALHFGTINDAEGIISLGEYRVTQIR